MTETSPQRVKPAVLDQLELWPARPGGNSRGCMWEDKVLVYTHQGAVRQEALYYGWSRKDLPEGFPFVS